MSHNVKCLPAHTWTEIKLNPTWVKSIAAARAPSSKVLKWAPCLFGKILYCDVIMTSLLLHVAPSIISCQRTPCWKCIDFLVVKLCTKHKPGIWPGTFGLVDVVPASTVGKEDPDQVHEAFGVHDLRVHTVPHGSVHTPGLFSHLLSFRLELAPDPLGRKKDFVSKK